MKESAHRDAATNALDACLKGDFEGARIYLEDLPVQQLPAVRQACIDLDNEIHCLAEAAATKPKVKTR